MESSSRAKYDSRRSTQSDTEAGEQPSDGCAIAITTGSGEDTQVSVDDVTEQHLSTTSVPFYVIVQDDEIAMEPERENFKPIVSRAYREGWRVSIVSEIYDPSTDDSTDDEAAAGGERTAKTSSQRHRIAEAVKDTLLFRSLDEVLINRVIDAMFERKVEPDEHVIRQGDDGDNFYVIETGVYDVLKRVGDDEQQLVLRLEGRGSFGELALMYNQPRAASVVSSTGGVLWAMNRKSFRRIVLRSAYQKRQTYDRLLSNVSFLRPLSDYERASVADALRSITYSDGELIVREGESPPNGLYIIERGAAKVTVNVHQSSAPNSPDCSEYANRAVHPTPTRSAAVGRAPTGTVEKVVAWLGVGDFFGEYALLENVPQSASVYAVAANGLPREDNGQSQTVESDDELTNKVVVAFIDGDSFDRLIGHYRSVMKKEMHGRSASLPAYDELEL